MSIEKEISELEQAITRLSHDYDVFLYGNNVRLPAEQRRALDRMARSISAQTLDSAADRYRLNAALGRYAAECERWERAVRDKEEGRGRFARAGAHPLPAANAAPPASVHRTPADSPERELFDRYRQARERRGEDVGRLSFEKFREMLARERERLREKTGKPDWSFDVVSETARVKLVARPAGGKKE
jgi:hypothetical protein